MHRAIGVNGATPRSAAVPETQACRVPVVLPEPVHRITADVRPVTDARRVTDRLASLRDHRLVGEQTILIDREAPLVFRFDAEPSAWLLGGTQAQRVPVPLHWRTPTAVGSDPAGAPPAGEGVTASPSGGRTASHAEVRPVRDRLAPDQEASRRGTLSELLGRAWASSRATARFRRKPRYGTTAPDTPGAPDATLRGTPPRAAHAVRSTEGDDGAMHGRPRPAASPSVPHQGRPACTPAGPAPEPATPRPASHTNPAGTAQPTPAPPEPAALATRVPTTPAPTAQGTTTDFPAGAPRGTAPAASRPDPRTAQTAATDTAQPTAGVEPAPQLPETSVPAAVRGADTVVSAAVADAVVPVVDRSSGVEANPPGTSAEQTHYSAPAERGSATSQPRDPVARAADAAPAPLRDLAEDTHGQVTRSAPVRTSSSPESAPTAPAPGATHVPATATGLSASATGSDAAPVETAVGAARPSGLRSFRWVAGARTAVRRRLRGEPHRAPEDVPNHPVPAQVTAEPSSTTPKPSTAMDAARRADPATGSPGVPAVGTNTGSAVGAAERTPVNSEAGTGKAPTTGPSATGGTPKHTSAHGQAPVTARSQGRPEAQADNRPVVDPAPTRSGAGAASRPSAKARPLQSRSVPSPEAPFESAPGPGSRPWAPEHTTAPSGPSAPSARTTTPGAVLTTFTQRPAAPPDGVKPPPAAAQPSGLRSFRWIAGAGTAVRRRLRGEPRRAAEDVPNQPVPAAQSTAEPSPVVPEAQHTAADAIERPRTGTLPTAGPEAGAGAGVAPASYPDADASVRDVIPEHTSAQEPGTTVPQDRPEAVLRARPATAAGHRHPVAGPVIPRRSEARTAEARTAKTRTAEARTAETRTAAAWVGATRPTPCTDQRQAAPSDVDTPGDTTFDPHDDARSAAVAPDPVPPRTASRSSAEAGPRRSHRVPADSARQLRADSSTVEPADSRTLRERAVDASGPGVLPAPAGGRSATEAETGPRRRRSGGAPATVTAPAEPAPPVHPLSLMATTDATDPAPADPPSQPCRPTSPTRHRLTTESARVPEDEQRSSGPDGSPSSRTLRSTSDAPLRTTGTPGAAASATTADSNPVPLDGAAPAERSALPAPRRRGATASRSGGLGPEAEGKHAPGATPTRRVEDAPAPAASVQGARQAREDDAPSVSDAARHRAVSEVTPTKSRRPVARQGDALIQAARATTGVPAAPERPVAVPATLAPAPVVPHDADAEPRTGSNDAPRGRHAGTMRLSARPALEPDTTRSALPARPGTPDTAGTPAHPVTAERPPRDHGSAGGVWAGGSVSPATPPAQREDHEHHKADPPAPRQAQRRPAPLPKPAPKPSRRPQRPVPDVPGNAPDAAPHAPSGAAPLRFAGPATRTRRSPQVATRTVRAPRSAGTGTAPSYASRRGPLGHAAETAAPEADALSAVPGLFLASGAVGPRGPLVTGEALPCSWILTPFGPPGRPRLMQPAPDPEPLSPSEFPEGHAVFRPIAMTEPAQASELPDGHAVFRRIATETPQTPQTPRVPPHAPKHVATAPQWGIPPGLRSPEEEASS